jgi:hypothetical protein
VSVHDHDEKIFQILNNPLLPQAQISSAIIFFLSMGFQQNHCIQSLSTLEHPFQEESSSSSTLHLCSLNRSSAIFLFWSPVQEDGPWSGQIQTHAHYFHELFCEAYTQTHHSPVNLGSFARKLFGTWEGRFCCCFLRASKLWSTMTTRQVRTRQGRFLHAFF